MQDEILSTLVLNKMKGNLKPLVVRAPSFGERRKNMCEDMAALTGGMFINPEIGYTLEGIEVAALGRASKVISNSQTTTIIGGKGTIINKVIDQRCISNRPISYSLYSYIYIIVQRLSNIFISINHFFITIMIN